MLAGSFLRVAGILQEDGGSLDGEPVTAQYRSR